MVPCKLIEFRFNSDTSPLPPHVTPVQGVAGSVDPGHGAFVALAPEQFQPAKLDGQLVMPSLKAHRALASDCCWLDVGAMDGDIDGKIEGGVDSASVGEKVGDNDQDGDLDGAIDGDSLGLKDSDGDNVGFAEGPAQRGVSSSYD